MRLHEQLSPAWLSDPDGHRDEIRALVSSFLDPEERLDRDLPLLLSEDLKDELREIVEEIKRAEGRVTRAEHHAALKLVNSHGDEAGVYERKAKVLRVLFVELCEAVRPREPRPFEWEKGDPAPAGTVARFIETAHAWKQVATTFTFSAHEIERFRRDFLEGVREPAALVDALDALRTQEPTEKRQQNGREVRVPSSTARALYEEYADCILPASLDDFLLWFGPSSARTDNLAKKPLSWTSKDGDRDLVEFAEAINTAARGERKSGKRSHSLAYVFRAFGKGDEYEKLRKRYQRPKKINPKTK